VAKALYSLPTCFVGKRLRARADRSTVRFYEGATLVKTHARQVPGGKSIDPSDYPEHKTAYALRDLAFLEQQASKHGESIGRFAHALLDTPLLWTRMRSVYALLGFGQTVRRCARRGSLRDRARGRDARCPPARAHAQARAAAHSAAAARLQRDSTRALLAPAEPVLASARIPRDG
jgi:hypothetical protein